MKKFSLMAVIAIVALTFMGSTASAQCGLFGGNGLFGHRNHCGPRYHSCSPCVTYTYYTYPSCSGYVVQGYAPAKKVVMPSADPNPPYQGEPKKVVTPPAPPKVIEEPTLPPKKIQPPNPKQDGPTTSIQSQPTILYINGIAHGKLSDGSYANIPDGTYSRLTAAYGSK